jgi:hypothetical protein
MRLLFVGEVSKITTRAHRISFQNHGSRRQKQEFEWTYLISSGVLRSGRLSQFAGLPRCGPF